MLARAAIAKESPGKKAAPSSPKSAAYSSVVDEMESDFPTPKYSWSFADIPLRAPNKRSRAGSESQPPPMQVPLLPTRAKLEVGAVDDPLEREADRVAEQVMRMPEPAATNREASRASANGIAGYPTASDHGVRVQRKCLCGGSCDKCKSEESDDEHGKLQRKPETPQISRVASSSAATGMEAPPIVHEVLRSPGQPLDGATRAFFEPRFGHDFSSVRVHSDSTADASARAVRARAYTAGHHIVLGSRLLGPGIDEGRRLLAHELAHVVQQQPEVRHSPVPGSGGQGLGSAERDFFESQFGHSFAHVRVHDGAEAASSARHFGALAFTYGNHVVLGDGVQGSVTRRRQVLAHELAHVLQYQGTAEARRVEVGAPGSAAEAEADTAGERVLAGHRARITVRDPAPVVRRMIPGKKCSNDEHALLIGQWTVRLAVYRELLKDSKYDNVRAAMLSKIAVAEALLKGYQACGRINAPSTGVVGLVTTPVTPTPIAPPVYMPPPVVEPFVEPPTITTPVPETPTGMSGGGVGVGVVIALAGATIDWALNRALSPGPSGTEITVDDLKQVMTELENQMNGLRKAIEAGPQLAPAPKVTPQTKVDTDTDVDKDEKPDDEEKRRSCDVRDRTCLQVPIPRKGGSEKEARRHNRCADSVTIPAYKGQDVCINGKAFDAVDAAGALWEIKAHAWSYANVYKDSKMADRIGRDIAFSIFDELIIARTCRRRFRVGVRDGAMIPAIKKYLPGLDITVLKC